MSCLAYMFASFDHELTSNWLYLSAASDHSYSKAGKPQAEMSTFIPAVRTNSSKSDVRPFSTFESQQCTPVEQCSGYITPALAMETHPVASGKLMVSGRDDFNIVFVRACGAKRICSWKNKRKRKGYNSTLFSIHFFVCPVQLCTGIELSVIRNV